MESTTSFGALPKFAGPLAGTIWPLDMSDEQAKTVQKTHVCSALEDDWLVTRAFTVCKCADGLGRLVWKSGKEIVEALKAKCF